MIRIHGSMLNGSRRGKNPGARRVFGFTLLELMIVVAIVAILARIALSAYDFATRKARRGAAQGCLSERALYMERFYATNLRYDQTIGGVAVVLPACSTDVSAYYTPGASSGFTAAPTTTTFKVEFTAYGKQARDTSCLILSIDQVGLKLPAGCW